LNSTISPHEIHRMMSTPFRAPSTPVSNSSMASVSPTISRTCRKPGLKKTWKTAPR
jgi:hypothetical protein